MEGSLQRVSDQVHAFGDTDYSVEMTYTYMQLFIQFMTTEPHSSVGSVAALRIRGCWFDPLLGQYSFLELIVIAIGFIPLSLLSVVTTMVTWESSQWLRKSIVHGTG